MQINILRIDEIIKKMGISRSSFYSQVDSGLLTKPVSIGDRSVGIPENEINQILKERVAGKSRLEIITLVKELHARRIDAEDGR